MSDQRALLPPNQGRPLQRPRVDRYAVRWREGGYWHVRYFVLDVDAEAMLAYVRQFAPDAYTVSVQ